ncbi:MAG: prolyl oligopeptidase family serine peptidase [Actinobacteria bacterium]|uniref:prolyl oligopeptidase n=1 Tax=freshwater metagenome TaxID=449393 RepID=A0A6J7C6U1_9ZZZZ|nr:prolyl oligopeptidase family serine peptidase [Actinomycetota bacterium]MSX55960.1 prolyl oligopeptidase family serine peptidase [Actinomycetota bacterium]MSX93617.1 prolyl oligopeptidase family serine peptidase [Actinomycetota bacterium]MSZ82718.1 prolyl oligopeptidase family serine peptidase [Actinomycetota bacterium]MTB17620.1 prolyl oligopeptidase family serine peptidase [Actinomycetota bacterium]
MADTPVAPVPATRRGTEADVYHGVEVPDPYRWLEDGNAVEVTEWVAAHNQRTREALVASPVWARWHERLSALTALPTTLSLSVAGEHLFVIERPAGADQYVLVLRSAVDPSVPPRTLLDPAALADDHAVAIDWFHPSPDGTLVAIGLSEGGTENSVLHVLEVATGRVLPLRIPNTRAASVAWRPDGSGFWYAVYPSGDEYHRHIRYHSLTAPIDGAPAAVDPVVFDRLPTPESWPDVSISDDGRYVLVHVMAGWTRIDVHMLEVASGEWTVVVAGQQAQTSLRVVGDELVGVTTLDAPNGRVIRAALTDPTTWTTVVAERPDVVLGAHISCADELLVVASQVGIDVVERWPGGERLDLGVASVVALDAADGRAFLARGTFGAPIDVHRFTAADGVRSWGAVPDATLLPQLSVTQIQYPSLDGTLIPMFVAHRVDIVPSADTPLILTGYGGFAIAESPVWMPNLAAWCAAGGAYCIAGLRGGYEYGEAWHLAGRRANKQHVFDDFHAAADWLVAEGYTSRDLLALHGGSNGGLLMGAAVTQRPDLAPVVWCAVPLLDMIRYPQFLIARLWTDEYGDPDVAEEFGWLHAYSPYHHVTEGQPYPAVLFTTAEGDTRVDPCHARKMAAALTWASSGQDERPILLLQSGRAGHGVGKPASMRVMEGADVLAFFCRQLGFEPSL